MLWEVLWKSLLQRVQLLKKYLRLPPVLPHLSLGNFTGILPDELLLREAAPKGSSSWEVRSCGNNWLELFEFEVVGFLMP